MILSYGSPSKQIYKACISRQGQKLLTGSLGSVTPLLCPRYCSTTLGGKVTGANLVPESVLPRGLPPESASCIFPPCCVCTSFPPRLSTFFFCSVLTCSVLSCFVYYLENAESLISRGLLSLRPCLKAFAPNDING